MHSAECLLSPDCNWDCEATGSLTACESFGTEEELMAPAAC